MGNKTALVTGASDGIGLEFSDILAARGYDLVLVARREDKLNEVSAKLSEKYGINCTVMAADLSVPQAAQTLFQRTCEQNLQIDFLVNNAGLLHNGVFTELSLAEQERMITVNVLALTSLSHLYANDMATRKKGYILNLASLAAWMAIPNQNVYAATKAYVLSFTQALADEMKAANNGVVVSALCPGYTATKMMDNPDQGAKLRIAPNMMMSAKDVAEAGIKGCLAGKSAVVPGVANKMTAAITRLFSKTLLTKLVGSFYRNNMD
ncbi:MAG: short-subunit dehydrogenase [Porticoccaceae bacterium]|jgi:short-subunit dehydrogenase|nr:SDR family oxidoreductase [Porticoccaceae bacterium]|tara:strand:- start:314 stop:1108 length:795 start_codon:yes stop_codon:yes gene_type:complete